VTCRVLKIARQPYHRWLAAPVTNAELEQAYRGNALSMSTATILSSVTGSCSTRSAMPGK
jgi:hypothetical protein